MRCGAYPTISRTISQILELYIKNANTNTKVFQIVRANTEHVKNVSGAKYYLME